jgi:hypothetical protein
MKASLLDLSGKQIASIERAVGVPVDHWDAKAPKGELLPAILAAVEGGEPKDYADLPLSELLDRVDLGGADPNEKSGSP